MYRLSYGVKTTRPSYYHLRSDVDYVSRYTLQTGEPTLKNEVSHQLGLMGRWRFMSFAVNYEHIKDAIYDWTTPYNEDGVVMIGMVNFDQPIDKLGMFVNLSPTIAIPSMPPRASIKGKVQEAMSKSVSDTSPYKYNCSRHVYHDGSSMIILYFTLDVIVIRAV